MADLFSNLAGRALGTAAVIRPVIAPRFARGPEAVLNASLSGVAGPDEMEVVPALMEMAPEPGYATESEERVSALPSLMQATGSRQENSAADTAPGPAMPSVFGSNPIPEIVPDRHALSPDRFNGTAAPGYRHDRKSSGAPFRPEEQHVSEIRPVAVQSDAGADKSARKKKTVTSDSSARSRSSRARGHVTVPASPLPASRQSTPQGWKNAPARFDKPALPVLVGAAVTPGAGTHAPEPKIEVKIGRIEVRAIQAPAPHPKPKPVPRRKAPVLTLEAYLKQRDGGQR